MSIVPYGTALGVTVEAMREVDREFCQSRPFGQKPPPIVLAVGIRDPADGTDVNTALPEEVEFSFDGME